MDFKLIGSILLIVGTSIGAGMLALPIATAQLGFAGSLILLVACWFFMTAGALLILEVNLWLPSNSNLISMAKATIGPAGQLIAWVTYILLLYSLLCAYVAGGSGLLNNLLRLSGIDMPQWIAVVVFLLIFGSVVYMGIRAVDYTNRALMFLKVGAYVILVLLLLPLVSSDYVHEGSLLKLTSAGAITVTLTSFGYAAIVPSLRIYFAGDVHKLRKAIFIGSLIPLFCYTAWDLAIMGVIPLSGEHSLTNVANAHDSVSSLVNTLIALTHAKGVIIFTKLFTSVCMLTSFLGVGLCLTDFLADGLKLEKKGSDHALIHALTFIPPLVIVIFMPGMFLKALKYAGVYCIVLLVLLPAWMAWNGRYKRDLHGSYVFFGGKPMLFTLIWLSVALSAYSLWELLA